MSRAAVEMTVFVSPPPSRPRHFETWEAALWFAQFSASRRRRRFAVRLETGLRGLAVWAVREVAP